MIALDTALQEAVRKSMLAEKVPAFDKRRQVTDLIREALGSLGSFYKTADGRGFFFSRLERRLYDLEQRAFACLLTSLSGLSATESVFRFVLDVLQTDADRTAPLVEVHVLADYDPTSGRLAVFDGGAGVWLRERGGEWRIAHNGDAGLFLAEPEAVAWAPEFNGSGEPLKHFMDGFLFGGGGLTNEEQQTLLTIVLLQQFFPPLRRTRVIPAFLGPQGSGKSTAMRRIGSLFLGPRFEVSNLQREREDAFVADVTNRTVCALDNADSRVPWLEDKLATYATGGRYRLRRLYTTNEMVSYEPRAVLMLSSRDPHFNRPDVAERLLPLFFERPDRYQPEERLFRELDAQRPGIWGALLTRLGTIADGLAGTEAPGLRFRMADFASFGWRVFASVGRSDAWEALLARLEHVQSAFAADGDGLIEALRHLLAREGRVGPIEIGGLFRECQQIASAQGLAFPKTAQGFGMRLTNLRRVVELELGVRVREERRRARARWVEVVPVGDAGGDGDGVRGKVFTEESA